MWPQLGLHLRHQRSRLFCVIASIWGIWLHWTLFFTSCKRIFPTHSVCMRDGQKLAVHLMPSFLFCCLHMSDLDKLDTYWCLGLRSQLASCTGRHMKSPLWYLHRYVRAPNTVCHCHICKRASRYETAYGILIVLFKKYFFIPLSCIAQNRLQLLYSVKQKTINYSQLHFKPT